MRRIERGHTRAEAYVYFKQRERDRRRDRVARKTALVLAVLTLLVLAVASAERASGEGYYEIKPYPGYPGGGDRRSQGNLGRAPRTARERKAAGLPRLAPGGFTWTAPFAGETREGYIIRHHIQQHCGLASASPACAREERP